MFAVTEIDEEFKIRIPSNFMKIYKINKGDQVSWTNTKEGILLNIEKKYDEEDIIGLVKEKLPYSSVELKKRAYKNLNI